MICFPYSYAFAHVVAGSTLVVLQLAALILFSTSFVPSNIEDRHVEANIDNLPTAMDQAVRILYGPNQDAAEEYISQHRSSDFRFYVYDNLREDRTWQYLSKCIEEKMNKPGAKWNKYSNKTSNCDWGSSICTETTRSSGPYSTRRFNRNGDVVLSKIFSEYEGILRTRNPDEADLFIVPYASTAHCACKNKSARNFKVKSKHVKNKVLDNLDYFNSRTRDRHLFFKVAPYNLFY